MVRLTSDSQCRLGPSRRANQDGMKRRMKARLHDLGDCGSMAKSSRTVEVSRRLPPKALLHLLGAIITRGQTDYFETKVSFLD